MNKYQKALEEVKEVAKWQHNIYIRYGYIRDEDIAVLEELVDKATPIKILKSVDENGEPCLPRNHGVCPICGFVVEYSDKYCCKCGKRLE